MMPDIKKKITKRIITVSIILIIVGANVYHHLPNSRFVCFTKDIIQKVPLPISPEQKPKEISLPVTPKGQISEVSYSYDVTPLVGETYDACVHWAIEDAKKSIYMVMFIVKPYNLGADFKHSVNFLIQDLIKARKRGVRVHLLLDNPVTEEDNPFYKIHKRVIEYLRGAGVDAKFATQDKKTHDKLIIIDDRVVIIGTHNWTLSGFKYNVESSVKIEITPPDPTIKDYFFRLEKEAEDFAKKSAH